LTMSLNPLFGVAFGPPWQGLFLWPTLSMLKSPKCKAIHPHVDRNKKKIKSKERLPKENTH
jgi:hypothetical protein